MFGRKKEDKTQTKAPATRPTAGQRSKGGYGQMGLLDMPDMSDMGNFDGGLGDDDDDVDDEDLEAELMALQAGLDVRKVISRHRLEVESQSKHEFGSDDNEDDDNVDENDPELLAELQVVTETKQENSSSIKPQALPLKPAVQTRSNGPPPSAAPTPAPRPVAHVPVQPSAPVPQQQFPTYVPTSAAPPPPPPPPPPSNAGSVLDVLQERFEMYGAAHAAAKQNGETAKIRRLERGIKTLESMLKTAKAERPVNEDDIPPPVAVGSKPAQDRDFPSDEPMSERSNLVPPVGQFPDAEGIPELVQPPPLPPRMRPAPAPPPSAPPVLLEETSQPPLSEQLSEKMVTMQLLQTRRTQYRQAAIAAKNQNNKERTLQFVKIVKQFDIVIAACEAGQEVDLSDMPPPPSALAGPSTGETSSSTDANVTNRLNVVPMEVQPSIPDTSSEPATDERYDSMLFNAPPLPTSALDALQQRLHKYRSAMEEASASDNASKARRMGRIVKQYEDAIKAYKAGRPVDFNDLPTPPGFAPIPTGAATAADKAPDSQPAVKPSAAVRTAQVPAVGPVPSATLAVPVPPNQVPAAASDTTPGPPARSPTGTIVKHRSPQALHEKQHAMLVERQKLFKVAALEAKRRDDIQAAKEYLKLAKGFDPMIKASLCGLPVNMDSMPTPPQQSQDDSFELVAHEDCEPVGDREEVFAKLDKELIAQIEMCANTRSHFSKIGDVQSKKKFETLLLNTKKDLDFVRHANKGGFPIPRFHYETMTFSIVRCFTDLGDDDMELTVIRGINYSCPNPSDVDTYVKYEFPYPPEAHQKEKTHTVKNSNNPEYNALFKLSMNRKARTLTRVVKRQAIKLEIWTKGGFLRSDALLGTVTVKLAPLETRCLIHDSFDLMEGRKPVGGKLEVQIRIRDPILNKQVETLCQRWLVVSGTQTTQL